MAQGMALSGDEAREPGETPIVFISHRHEDADIAKRLGTALLDLLGEDAIRVFNTSDQGASGPIPGTGLSQGIKAALGKSSLVILLYTRDDDDWRWCFFECGIALDPLERIETTIVVLDFGTGEGTKVFEGDVHVVVDQTQVRGQKAPPEFHSFIASVHGGAYLHAPTSEAKLDESELPTFADRLYADLVDLGPAAQAELTSAFLEALTTVPAEHRKEHLRPLFEGAAKALRWGLADSSGVRELFVDYWNERLLQELKRMAARQLVFRPGRVYLHWRALLNVCFARFEADTSRIARLDRPVLALVSHEDRGTGAGYLDFWLEAMHDSNDPWFYEDPVRWLSRELQKLKVDDREHPLVERILVLKRSDFDQEAATQTAAVVNWMSEANIGVAIAFEDQRPLGDLRHFSDFGIVGDIAISRFSSSSADMEDGNGAESGLSNTTSRSLTEDFAHEEIQAALDAWRRLRAVVLWSSTPGKPCEPAELLAALKN